ncbi:hypothetical protein NEOKW01_1816 [Nematocida sp. AWRm80]|nr:hypothetical protein NEOKW01_1816 [Nematocida sp. AWRm80]
METVTAIKLPKTLPKENLTLVKYKSGKTFIKSDNKLYPISEYSLEIPKYLISEEGEVLCKITSRGVVQRLHSKQLSS